MALSENKKASEENIKLPSTYGVLLAEAVLSTYSLAIDRKNIQLITITEDSIFHAILRVPYKNFLNGIIFDQVKDYQSYLQKLFVDYMLSEASQSAPELPGAQTREQLESFRQELLSINENFATLEREHNEIFATAQSQCIKAGKEWNALILHTLDDIRNLFSLSTGDLRSLINNLLAEINLQKQKHLDHKDKTWGSIESEFNLSISKENKQIIATHINKIIDKISADLEQVAGPYLQSYESNSEQSRTIRTSLYNLIVETKEALKRLPDYLINDQQDQKHLVAISFKPL